MSLHSYAAHLPTRDEILSTRADKIKQAVELMDRGIAAQSVPDTMRGLKRAYSIKNDSVIALAAEESSALLVRAMRVALDYSRDWASLSCATRAINLAVALLTPRTPALADLAEVRAALAWDRLYALVLDLHSNSALRETTAKRASDEVLRLHSNALFELVRIARFYQERDCAQTVWRRFEQDVSSKDSPQLHESQMHLFMFYPGGSSNGSNEARKQTAEQEMVEAWFQAWGLVDANGKTYAEWDAAWFGLLLRALKSNPALLVDKHLNALFARFHAALMLDESSGGGGNMGGMAAAAARGGGADRKLSPWQKPLAGLRLIKAAKLLVHVLHVSDAIKRLEHLVQGTHTFMHPSNQGAHADRLSGFVSLLCEAFAKRLGAEGVAAASLAPETKKRFIQCVYPLIEMGLYSKSLSVVSNSQAALRHLAWLAPVTLSQHALPIVAQGLDPGNVTRSHQTSAAMKILTTLVQPMVYGSAQSRAILLPALAQFLENALPGIDPNDSRKTAVSLLMSYSVLSCVPLVHASEFAEKHVAASSCCAKYGIDPVVEDRMEVDEGLGFGNRLELWALDFFRRVFALAQARGQRAKQGTGAQLDKIIDFLLQETVALVYARLARERRVEALEEISRFLTDTALPDAHREAVSLARCLIRVDPERALAVLVPKLLPRVDANGDAKTVKWSLVILGALCREGGLHLLPHAERVYQVAVLGAFAHKDAGVRYLGAKLVRRLARGLLATYPIGQQGGDSNFSPVYETAPVTVQWHVPAEKEVAFATQMLDGLKKMAFNALLLQQEQQDQQVLVMDVSVTGRERTNHMLVILFQCVRGGLTHFNRGEQRASDLTKLLACTALLKDRDNIYGLKLCIKTLALMACQAQGPKGAGDQSKIYAYRAWSTWLREVSQNKANESFLRQNARREFAQTKRGTGALESPAGFQPVHLLLHDVQFMHDRETYFAPFPQVTRESVELPSEMLLALCFHAYSEVRKCAQAHLEMVDFRSRFALRERIVSEILPKLSSNAPQEFTGAVFLLRQGSALRHLTQNDQALESFLRIAMTKDGIATLPDFRQSKARDRLARLIASTLNRWQELVEFTLERKRALCQDLIQHTAQRGGDWRNKLFALTVMAVFNVQEDALVARFVLDMTKHDMLPTRLAALYVVRRLLLTAAGGGNAMAATLQQQLSSPAEITEFWTKAGATLGQDRTTTAQEQGGADWSAGVGDCIKLVRSLLRRVRFPRLASSGAVSHDFHVSKVDLFSAYCNALPLPGVEPVLAAIKKLATEGESSTDRAERRLSACEMFAAVLALHPEHTAEFFPILLRMLAELPSASNWCDAATYIACFSRDGGAELVRQIELEMDRVANRNNGEPEMESERETGFSYMCNLVTVLGALLQERGAAIPSNTFARFEALLTHPYKAVRQAASTILAFLYMHSREFDTARAVRAMLRVSTEEGKEGLESALCFVAVLVVLCPAKHLLRDVVEPLIGPVVFAAQGHEEVELAKFARSVLSLCASQLKCFAVEDARDVVKFEEGLIQRFASHEEWSKRRALCVFLRTFHAGHSTFLLGLGAGALVQRTSEDLLNDANAEVRDAARTLLLSLLVSVPVTSLDSAKNRYCQMVKDARKQQRGILALTALVEASPYTAPSALPPSLAVLATFVNHASLGLQVKRTLSEFRRTHIDEWAEHKQRFSEEELDALEGVLFSPDYYA